LDQKSLWEARGPYLVASYDVDNWTAVDDGEFAVFAQVPTDTGAERLPVVVLSHGLGGDHHGYAPLGAHLASHGYAVLHPQYRDSRSHLVRTGQIDPVAASGSAADEAVAVLVKAMLFDPQHWWSRVRRARALIDSLSEQQRLDVNLDPSGVTVAGHSYGAYTTQLLIGARLFGVGPELRTCAHPAVTCGVLISPQGSGDRGLTERSWDQVVTPMLVITAERDFGPNGEGVDWRREPFDRAASPLRHLAIVADTDHHMGGIASTDEAPVDEHELGRAWSRRVVSALTLAFVEAARGDREAVRWLAADPLATAVKNEHVGGPS